MLLLIQGFTFDLLVLELPVMEKWLNSLFTTLATLVIYSSYFSSSRFLIVFSMCSDIWQYHSCTQNHLLLTVALS